VENKNLILGKNIVPLQNYDPAILNSIKRSKLRNSILLPTECYGLDRWTCYEFSWLGTNGVPKSNIISIEYSSDSSFFIESKSLKIYMNSYNNFIGSEESIKEQIISDLEDLLKVEVKVKLMNEPYSFDPRKIYTNIDNVAFNGTITKVDKTLLSLSSSQETNSFYISCNLFRSLCPVTGQPDWASILINYKGKLIEEVSILNYLLSYRYHQGFHEECVELIFTHINSECSPEELSIEARFLRRGGIEINPFRSSLRNFSYLPYRDLRQ